jgi:ribonucleoside-diphosphate reductase alpha chain
MDCDTTGIEPDFALVKFKKLAGGGYFKIVNQSVARALRGLGYTEQQIADIDQYVRGTMTLLGGPGIDRAALREKGLNEDDLRNIEAVLPGAFSLEGAVTPWVVGEKTMTRLGIAKERAAQPGFSLLRDLGFNKGQIEHASDVICGRMTVEGAPHLLEQHLPIFDCANRCGREGKRYIEPRGHLRMMAAAQPFISGAISKTVNVPTETNADDIEQLYIESWGMGLKAVAIYRDGSKQSQPLSSSGEGEKTKESTAAAPIPVASTVPAAAEVRAALDAAQPVMKRERLPRKRGGFTQEARVGGQKIYLRTGEYEDGRLGEIFIDMHKEGAAYRSVMNCFAIAVSLGLQYGVPLDEFVDCFTFTRFEPHGHTDHPNVRFSTSIVDYVFRVLAMEYLGRHDMVQVPPEFAAHSPARAEEPTTARAEEPAAPAAREEETDATSDEDEAPAKSETVSMGNGHGNGHGNGSSNGSNGSSAKKAGALRAAPKRQSGITEQLTMVMKDAPFCDTCGHLTVRNGACYKCLNCGQAVGCS